MELFEEKRDTDKKLIEYPIIDGKHKRILYNAIKTEKNESVAKGMFTNSMKALPFFADPEQEEHSNILCIGKVQSGKTSFFITATALAFDNGYKIAYLIGGTKNKLKIQNEDRITDEFSGDESVDVFSANSVTVEQISKCISVGHCAVVVVLKNPAKKTNLGKILSLQKEFGDVPSLVIDDEADEVTPGAPKLKKAGKAGRTHDKISEIFKLLRCCTYLSVTATPQANMLLSKYDDLSPDFVVLVKPGEGYCGGNSFHDLMDNPHVITIKDSDDFENGSIPTTFVDAYHDFIFACCLKDDGEPYSMLVHPSRLNEVQNQIASAIQFYFTQTCKNMSSPGSFEYQASVDEICSAAKRYEARCGVSVDMSYIEKRIPDVISNLEMFVYNVSYWGRESMAKEKNTDSLYRIFIGGDMLGRGLTIKNLIVTYIYRDAKITAIDTLYQRARWFGYKEEYFDVCEVFMTKALKEKFIATVESENDMWNSINTFLLSKSDFKKFPRILMLNYQNTEDSKLVLTRTSVSKTIEFFRNNPGFTYDKSVHFKNQSDRAKNKELYEHCFEKWKSKGVSEKLGDGRREESLVIDMPYSTFYDDFLVSYVFPLATKLGSRTFDDILQNIKDGNSDDFVKIVIMRYMSREQRSLDISGYEVEELLQGRSDDGVSYVGDKNIFPDEFHIQIHLVYHDDKDDYTPLLAMRNPLTLKQVRYVTGDEFYDEICD